MKWSYMAIYGIPYLCLKLVYTERAIKGISPRFSQPPT